MINKSQLIFSYSVVLVFLVSIGLTCGNCLLGSLILFWKKRKNSPKIVIGFRPGTFVPHFIVKTKKYFYHYKTEKDILPWPFCYLIFIGSFQVLRNNKLYIFEKNRE